MTDKDLLVVISEMLRKQDQQSEQLMETNTTLKQLVDISLQQFQYQQGVDEQQQAFNQQMLNQFQQQQNFNEQQLESNSRQQAFNEQQLASNDRQQTFNERQQTFNERFLDKLTDIETALKK